MYNSQITHANSVSYFSKFDNLTKSSSHFKRLVKKINPIRLRHQPLVL